MTVDGAGSRRRVLNRLRRAQGQLAAVIAAVERGEPCREVATQIAATSKAIDRAGVVLITDALQECLTYAGADPEGDELTPSEFEKLFMMFA